MRGEAALSVAFACSYSVVYFGLTMLARHCFTLREKINQAVRQCKGMVEMSKNPKELGKLLFNQGVKLYKEKEFRDAEQKLKRALELLPSSEHSMYYLALVYLKLQKYELAWELVNNLRQTDCQDIIDELRKAEIQK